MKKLQMYNIHKTVKRSVNNSYSGDLEDKIKHCEQYHVNKLQYSVEAENVIYPK